MSTELQERMYYRIVSMEWPEDQKAFGSSRNKAFGEEHKDRDNDSAQNEARKYNKMEKVKLLSIGGLGIGATIYRLADGRIIKITISGGMLDEDEDPFIIHEDYYDNFVVWFEGYKKNSGYNWIRFTPDYIHSDVKDYLKNEVDNYVNDSGYPIYGRENWYIMLDSTDDD
ncbi:MAG: hypothetical protein IPL55_19605 [Saprospiraceae bacterium]|nr:hypothetical protein [Saprospiraceae bacterium]